MQFSMLAVAPPIDKGGCPSSVAFRVLAAARVRPHIDADVSKTTDRIRTLARPSHDK
jgi:hypothetical protein